MTSKKNYSFKSLIPFIVGSVVGIGSYFKIGKILKLTDGSALIAISTWLISIFVIFCSILVISDFMSTKDNESVDGGLLHIIEKYTNNVLAKYINCLMLYLYLPVVACIESLVGAQFLFQVVLGINSNVLLIIATFVIMAIFFIANGKSISFGKAFQGGSLIIKLIPLSILIVFGLLFRPFLDHSHFYLFQSFAHHGKVNFVEGVIAASPATLFALDGWQWSTTLASETKGGTKTFVKAVIVGMIVISAIYVTYTLGGLSVISSNNWVSGDHGNPLSIAGAFIQLFRSEIFGKIISLFIVVAALGGLNGFSVFYNRQVKAASERGWLPKFVSKANKENGLSLNSSLFAWMISSLLWAIVCVCGYIWPTFFGTTAGADFDVTASLNLCSDIFSTGLFSLVYILFSVVLIKNKVKSDLEDKSFKLPMYLFVPLTLVMTIGGVYGVYTNINESWVVYLVGLVVIVIASFITPNKSNERL